MRSDIAKHFSDASTSYDAHATMQHDVLYALTDWLPESDAYTLFDAGCGTGAIMAHLPKHVTALGCDIAPGMCEAARAKGMEVMQSSVEKLPLDDASIDVYLSSLCWQWVEQPQRAIAEMQRILQSGGLALLAVLTQAVLSWVGTS